MNDELAVWYYEDPEKLELRVVVSDENRTVWYGERIPLSLYCEDKNMLRDSIAVGNDYISRYLWE